jgi:hypothetical protein
MRVICPRYLCPYNRERNITTENPGNSPLIILQFLTVFSLLEIRDAFLVYSFPIGITATYSRSTVIS